MTKSDYEKITKGMTLQDVEAALGKGQPATAHDALRLKPGASEEKSFNFQIMSAQKLLKWGTEKDYVIAGFSEDNKVRTKVFYFSTPNVSSGSQTFGVTSISGGKVEFKD